MSWSFHAVGKPSAVIKKARDELARYKCAEPEETIKRGFLAILESSLAAMPTSSAVQISASGSQSSQVGDDSRPTAFNSLNIEIKPLYGFVEDAPKVEAAAERSTDS